MRFRLDGQHYRENRLLEPGTEVGDGCDNTWRDGQGHAYPPSMQMTGIDEEGKRMIKEYFGTDKPDRDVTAAIPLQGTGDTIKIQAPGVPRPGTSPAAAHKAIIETANPKPNPAPTREPAK